MLDHNQGVQDGQQAVVHVEILGSRESDSPRLTKTNRRLETTLGGMDQMFGVECRSARRTVRIFMSGSHLFRTSIALSLLALCTSCAEMENATKAVGDAARTAAAAHNARPAYWNGNGVSGPPKIVVSLSNQRAYFYKGKRVIGESTISTGRKGYETPPGKYRVIQKDEHHVSSIYGDFVAKNGEIVKANVSSMKDHAPAGTHFLGANMPFFLRFTRSYGMHAGFVPRYRASHGCIRMPAEMAKHFFDAAQLDTPVIVKE